jgi:hypothetical protein
VSTQLRAGRAWAFRWRVEQIAHRAFARIGTELSELGFPGELVDASRHASEDEGRHVVLCAMLAKEYGVVEPAAIAMPEQLAPRGLAREDALVYEIVARCCIAETESTATLVELLPLAKPPVHAVVHEIAADEVKHARLGWQFLAHVAGRRDLGFLGPIVPAMLETGGGPLFDPSSPPTNDDPAVGTFSVATQRRIFVDVLEEVVFPGLELHGVATHAARAWLLSQQRRVATAG